MRVAYWLAVVALMLGVLGLGYYFVNCNRSDSFGPLERRPPVLVCPNDLDLGTREIKSIATGELTISNSGNEPLTLDGIRSDCACTGLERLTSEGPRRIESLTIFPHESVRLQVRVAVSGQVGDSATHNIIFGLTIHYTSSTV